MATKGGGEAPRAVIHKRILDSAESQPEATMAELAAEVAGASPDLVERVLEEYGDPGVEGSPDAEPTTEEPMSAHATPPTDVELTDRQRAALRAVADHPEATQAELADHLGVSRGTVNKWVNAIEGFEWSARASFAEAVLGDDATSTDDAPPSVAEAASDGGQLLAADDAAAVEQLQERLARLEQQVGDAAGDAGPLLSDATLTAKVVRAVVADDTITDEEELRVIETLL